MEFQRSQLEITKKSLEHYSHESRPIQITPWSFWNSKLEVPGPGQRGRRGLTGCFPARGTPAARVEGRGRFTAPVRTSRCPVLGSGWAVAAARRSRAGRRRRRMAEAAL